MVGANMDSDLILDTSHEAVKLMVLLHLHSFKCKLGPKCGENIQKLADVPSFYHTMSPQVGYGWAVKTLTLWLKHSDYGFRYDIIHITGVHKRRSNGYCMIF